MFRQNSLISQEAALVACLCVNENQHLNQAELDFSEESIPSSGVSSVSNGRTICGHAAAHVSPFPQIKWRAAGSHSKRLPKSWWSSPGELPNFLLLLPSLLSSENLQTRRDLSVFLKKIPADNTGNLLLTTLLSGKGGDGTHTQV